MPFTVQLKELPCGYALDDATGVEGSPTRVVVREFTSSEDGELLISRLDGWPTKYYLAIANRSEYSAIRN